MEKAQRSEQNRCSKIYFAFERSNLVTLKQNKHLIEEVRQMFANCEDVEIIYVSMEDVIAKWFSGRLAHIPALQDTTIN